MIKSLRTYIPATNVTLLILHTSVYRMAFVLLVASPALASMTQHLPHRPVLPSTAHSSRSHCSHASQISSPTYHGRNHRIYKNRVALISAPPASAPRFSHGGRASAKQEASIRGPEVRGQSNREELLPLHEAHRSTYGKPRETTLVRTHCKRLDGISVGRRSGERLCWSTLSWSITARRQS